MFDSMWTSFLDVMHSMLGELLIYASTLFSLATLEAFSSEYVLALFAFFEVIGAALFGIAAVMAYMENTIATQQGGGSLMSTTLNVFKGAAVLIGYISIPIQLMVLTAQSLTRLLVVLVPGDFSDFSEAIQKTTNGSSISIFTKITGKAFEENPNQFLLILFEFAFLYCLVKVALGAIKRSGTMVVLICVGTLHLFNIPRGYTDGFSSWCKQIAALCITHFVQSVALFIGFLIINTDAWIAGVSLMLVSTEVPRIAGAFGLDTSMKTNISQTVYTAGMATNVIRSLAK